MGMVFSESGWAAPWLAASTYLDKVLEQGIINLGEVAAVLTTWFASLCIGNGDCVYICESVTLRKKEEKEETRSI